MKLVIKANQKLRWTRFLNPSSLPGSYPTAGGPVVASHPAGLYAHAQHPQHPQHPAQQSLHLANLNGLNHAGSYAEHPAAAPPPPPPPPHSIHPFSAWIPPLLRGHPAAHAHLRFDFGHPQQYATDADHLNCLNFSADAASAEVKETL